MQNILSVTSNQRWQVLALGDANAAIVKTVMTKL